MYEPEDSVFARLLPVIWGKGTAFQPDETPRYRLRDLQVIVLDKIELVGSEEPNEGQKGKYFTFFKAIYSNLLR